MSSPAKIFLPSAARSMCRRLAPRSSSRSGRRSRCGSPRRRKRGWILPWLARSRGCFGGSGEGSASPLPGVVEQILRFAQDEEFLRFASRDSRPTTQFLRHLANRRGLVVQDRRELGYFLVNRIPFALLDRLAHPRHRLHAVSY